MDEDIIKDIVSMMRKIERLKDEKTILLLRNVALQIDRELILARFNELESRNKALNELAAQLKSVRELHARDLKNHLRDN